MTNEEAKEKLYMEWQKFLEDNIDYAGVSEAYKMAFKALEQEPVLDKIRAEIVKNSIEDYKYHGCGTDELIIETSEVLQIIDKYKGESEDKK